jgi:hypothetical protein
MGNSKFEGKYAGKYNKTEVQGGKITSTKGKATLTIAEVGKGAYLITTVDDGTTTYNELAFLEDDVLRAETQSGQGIVSTYFKGKHLISQLSNKSPTVWTVINYKFNKCKH